MRKARSTANGVERTNAQDTIATSSSASRKPTSGDSTMASSGLAESPLQTTADSPALATPAPTSPPISACELLDGMPRRQVITFQTMAPIRAPKITWASMTLGSTMPVPMVCGDVQAEHQEGDEVEERRPDHGVLRPQHAGRDDGGDRVGGVVQAVEEVEQQRDGDQADQNRKTEAWRPLRGPAVDLLDHDAADLVGDVLEAVDDLFEMVVDLGADDESHRRWRRGA